MDICILVEYQSGQMGWSQEPVAIAFVGSNPTSTICAFSHLRKMTNNLM